MSTVINIMILDNTFDERVYRVLRKLKLTVANIESVGGNKCLENNLWLGAFNYLDLDKFKEELKYCLEEITKIDKEDIQVFVKGQNETRWKEVDLCSSHIQEGAMTGRFIVKK